MARNAINIGIAALLLAAQYVVAQNSVTSMLATNAMWSGVKRDEIHSHLQRMLQMDARGEEPATHGGHLNDVFGIPLPSSFSAPGGQLKDAFGIPLPVAPSSSKPRPRADMDKPSDSPTTATTSVTKPTAPKTPKAGFDMTFEPQTPAMDSSALRRELEAFIAASPALQGATRGIMDQAADVAEQPNVEQEPKAEQQPEKQQEDTASGPAQTSMTDREAERFAAQQASNAAARNAALARKKQMVREEMAAAASKKTKRSATSFTGASSTRQPIRPTTSALPFSSAAPVQQQQQQQQKLRRTSSAKWGVLSYLLVTVVAVASLVGLFTAAAVLEDALVTRKYDSTASLPLHWLAVTRSLWRRVRRAFVAARKQLTGHGSHLPMSVHEGTGPVARAFAASSAFVHVFWSHLVDHRGQGLGSAVAAAVDASRRASAGGVAPDRSSSGGSVSPFAAPQYQQSFVMEADLRRRH